MTVQFSLDESSEERQPAHNNARDGSPQQPHHIPSSPKFAAKNLRANLMREHQNRDPLFYYEVLTVLGVGSMGSVAKVRKREAVVGGSARKEVQDYFKKEQNLRICFQLPLVGGFFQYCMKGAHQFDSERSDHTASVPNSQRSMGSSILQPKADGFESYNDGHGESTSKSELIYAMKSIHLSRITDPTFIEELKNEISILRTLDHPHIVKAIETFQHRNQIFVVMELCSGGDLYSRDPYTEEEAARITSSILSAISYMHERNVCHRDLKFENVLFANNSPKAEVKLIDFGLSRRFGNDELTDGVGTIYTMAPEVLKGKYTNQADVWSVGVIAYMLLSSQMPFFGRKKRHIVEQIMEGQITFKGKRWKRVSQQAKDFVSDLLEVDPDERATAQEAMSKSWLNRRYAATVRNPLVEEELLAHQSLLRYAKYSKLKKVALMVVAHKSTSTEIGILRKIFQKYDTVKDGHLSYDEFKAALKETGMSENECRKIFDAVDLDSSGKIRYTEFLAATIEAQGAISEERLAEAFDRLDSDDTGYISAANLREILGEDFPQQQIDAIIKESDITKDGKISYSEFLAQWENQNEQKVGAAMHDLKRLSRLDSNGTKHNTEPSSVECDSDESDIAARVNFIEGKIDSERKASSTTTMNHVVFQDIPITISSAGNGGTDY